MLIEPNSGLAKPAECGPRNPRYNFCSTNLSMIIVDTWA